MKLLESIAQLRLSNRRYKSKNKTSNDFRDLQLASPFWWDAHRVVSAVLKVESAVPF